MDMAIQLIAQMFLKPLKSMIWVSFQQKRLESIGLLSNLALGEKLREDIFLCY